MAQSDQLQRKIQCPTLKSERIFWAIRFNVKGLARGGYFYRLNIIILIIKKYVLVERKTLDFLAISKKITKNCKLGQKNSIVSPKFAMKKKLPPTLQGVKKRLQLR